MFYSPEVLSCPSVCEHVFVCTFTPTCAECVQFPLPHASALDQTNPFLRLQRDLLLIGCSSTLFIDTHSSSVLP